MIEGFRRLLNWRATWGWNVDSVDLHSVLKLPIRAALTHAETGDDTGKEWWRNYLNPVNFREWNMMCTRNVEWIYISAIAIQLLSNMVSSSKNIKHAILPNVGINNWQEERAWSQCDMKLCKGKLPYYDDHPLFTAPRRTRSQLSGYIWANVR